MNGFSVKSLSGVNPYYLPLAKSQDERKPQEKAQVVGKAVTKVQRGQDASHSEEASPVMVS